jgi:hypothetical protein
MQKRERALAMWSAQVCSFGCLLVNVYAYPERLAAIYSRLTSK